MEKGIINGEMEEVMRESMILIKNMGLGHIHGLMEESIQGSGLIAKDMGMGKSYRLMEWKEREFGRKTGELGGWMLFLIHKYLTLEIPDNLDLFDYFIFFMV